MTAAVDLGPARAWAWVAHLRAGGTTPWLDFGTTTDVSGGRYLPGAQQLELLRRANLAGSASPTLVGRILAASAPGRGRPDLELVGVDGDDGRRRFGPQPVDPAALPDHELLRVATGLLAEDLVAARVASTSPRRPRRLRTRYELVGDPWLADGHTRQLVAAGRPPGGAGRAVHVLGSDVATMLEHTWASRAFGAGCPPWPDFLAQVRARDRLPRRVDLAGVADRFRARPHTGMVDVVLDPSTLPRLLGVRRLAPVPDVSADAAELARQVGVALSLLVLPAEQAGLLGEVLRPRLERRPGVGPAVPPAHREWVEEAATRVVRRLARAGYPVVGDPERLVPRWAESTPPEPRGGVLDLALGLLTEVHRVSSQMSIP